MYHPSWYYSNYSKIIARSAADYAHEIDTISHMVPLHGKKVQEVGAGTGEHASRILQMDVSYLELIDIDIEAFDILQRRYGHEPNVLLRHSDGFATTSDITFDVIICMYSIVLQNISTQSKLERRINHLLQQIAPRGVLFAEIIDCNVSREVYPANSPTTIYKDTNSNVQIQSSYAQEIMTISYSGVLNGVPISYDVSMYATSKDSVVSLLKSLAITDFQLVKLDEYGRRLLVSVWK